MAIDGRTLNEAEGYWIAVFPRRGGTPRSSTI